MPWDQPARRPPGGGGPPGDNRDPSDYYESIGNSYYLYNDIMK